MTNREILEECFKHIQNKPNVNWVKCEDCPLFPERLHDGKFIGSICLNFYRKTGLMPDKLARCFTDGWLDQEADV